MTGEDIVADIVGETGEDPQIVQEALRVQQQIKRRGIRGIRFMGKSEEKMEAEAPGLTQKNLQKELRKRLR